MTITVFNYCNQAPLHIQASIVIKYVKANESHVKHSYCHPVNQCWNPCVSLRHLSPVQENTIPIGVLEVGEPRISQ